MVAMAKKPARKKKKAGKLPSFAKKDSNTGHNSDHGSGHTNDRKKPVRSKRVNGTRKKRK